MGEAWQLAIEVYSNLCLGTPNFWWLLRMALLFSPFVFYGLSFGRGRSSTYRSWRLKCWGCWSLGFGGCIHVNFLMFNPPFFREVHRLTWCSYVENWWSEFFFVPGPTLNFLLHLRGALNVLLKGTGAGSQTRLFTTLSLQSCLNYWVSWNIMEPYTNVYMYICMYRLSINIFIYIYIYSTYTHSANGQPLITYGNH